MTRRRRSRRALEASPREDQAVPTPTVDPDVAEFAARIRQQQVAGRDQKRAERESRRRAEEHQRLAAAKDAAAADVKRLRTQPRVTPSQTAEADAAYRAALGRLIEYETGDPPAWAASAAPAADPTARRGPDEPGEAIDGGAGSEGAG